MSENFFDKYKEFVVVPKKEQEDMTQAFDPRGYSKHFIVTFSLYDSFISCWREAKKYQIEAGKSIEKVVRDFNAKKNGSYRLQVLEFEEDNSYFVLALSCKKNMESEEAIKDTISNLLERDFSNDLLIGETWYQLIGFKGKFERRLFTVTVMKYTV